jgi:hypothetical protein
MCLLFCEYVMLWENVIVACFTGRTEEKQERPRSVPWPRLEMCVPRIQIISLAHKPVDSVL